MPVGTTITSGPLPARPSCSAPGPTRPRAHRLTQRQCSGLNARLGAWWSFAPRSTSTCSAMRRGRKRSEEMRHVLAGQGAERLARQPSSMTAQVGRTGPPRRARALRRAAHTPSRSGRCRAARRAPDRAPGRARGRSPRPCGDRRLEVAPAFEDQLEPGMPGERAEHVIEEADAGRDLRPAAAVEAEVDLDRRLQGLAGDRRPARVIRLPASPWQGQGTIWASAVTTMSVPPRALISGITRGRSARAPRP